MLLRWCIYSTGPARRSADAHTSLRTVLCVLVWLLLLLQDTCAELLQETLLQPAGQQRACWPDCCADALLLICGSCCIT
jgi:hypothetical protein